ncbi:kelch-like protein 38 [Stylonychia lemnae]|uniref:Kelch-like protein 38 n=1 Tax=Stylonychia lemnae TaxID=5949 RepID=A0A078AV16_STYLE|nr:kelch-like protein 38 [Stylonychia lemnae]|eukprot:CDW84708.1 kelch-like protein 38 [Stylonychia lemnae]
MRSNHYHTVLRSARLTQLHEDIDYQLREFQSPNRQLRDDSQNRSVSYAPNTHHHAQSANRAESRLHLLSLGPSTNKKRKFSGTSSDDENNNSSPNEINHSTQLSQDFSQFLFLESLSDIKIRVRKSTSHCVEIPAHRIVLSARCPYFQSKFCRDWNDVNQQVAHFEEFTENSMREILKYMYTGKLKIDVSSIMGVLKIASFLGLESLTSSCKQYLLNGYFNAFDLCILYCEVRDESTDFDEMRQFLVGIIPEKIENDILCRVLKEIWQSSKSRKQSTSSNNQPRNQALAEIQEVPSEEMKQSILENDEENKSQPAEKSPEQENQDSLKNSEEKKSNQNSNRSQKSKHLESIHIEVSEQDLQDILFEKLQKVLPEILEGEQTKQDFFNLPKDLILQLVSSSETLVSESLLFKAIEEKILSFKISESKQESKDSEDMKRTSNHNNLIEEYELQFLKCLLNHIRLPHINNKLLVTDIKFSGFFEDQKIFEALQFKLAREVISKYELECNPKFQFRGLNQTFDISHEQLQVQKLKNSIGVSIQKPIPNPDESSQPTRSSPYSAAIMSEQLPLHGIHYFEISVRNLQASHQTSNQAQQPYSQAIMKQVFVGLCSLNENQSLEDVHRAKNSVMLNCFDSSFWSNGQQLQVYSNKFIKIKTPIEAKDVIRIAVDLRHASKFKDIWKENQAQEQTLNGVGDNRDTQSRYSAGGSRSAQFNLRERLRDSIRYRGSNPNNNRGDYNHISSLNMIFGSHNELTFFNSPCRFHFAFNNSEFHEGVDLNLMAGAKDSPLHLVISILEQGSEVIASRHVYFDDWDMIPKSPFILNQQ